MINYSLIKDLLHANWFIDSQFVYNNLGFIADLVKGRIELEEPRNKDYEPKALVISAQTGAYTYYNWEDAPKGSVALIPVVGALTKNSQRCGPIGMSEIGRRIQEADESPKFIGTLLKIDSPGGTADGTARLGEIIKGATKPVLAFVDGLMASAALWIGTSANEVWAGDIHNQVGSVGVLSSFTDFQPAYEKLGIKFHLMVSNHSKDKTKMFEDIRQGRYEDYKTEFLDPLALRFQNVVKENRPNVKEEHVTGKMFHAENVMGVFIDRIGTIEEAVARIEEMARERETEKTLKSHISMKQFLSINKTLLVDQLEVVEGHVSLNETQLGLLDEAIAESETLRSRVTERDDELATANQDLETAQNELAQARAEIDELKKGPGAEHSETTQESDEPIIDAEEEFLSSEDVDFYNKIKQ